MEEQLEEGKPEAKFSELINKSITRKLLTIFTLIVLLFFPSYTRSDNGVMLETIFYFPWAIFRIFEPNPLYKTDQLQMLSPFSTIILMFPTYIAIFEVFKLLQSDLDLVKSSLKIAGAELGQILLLLLTLQSSVRRETHQIFFLGPILMIITYLGIAGGTYLEKARNDLYATE
ncbi:MAG: hypothetical protein D6732_12605 [Methanobacteriota archaeon]|nr:MAG: hypothetical protein D6732_12605 [Euryarchaeota archaeon]